MTAMLACHLPGRTPARPEKWRTQPDSWAEVTPPQRTCGLAQNSSHVQALTGGLLLPVALYGEFNGGAGRNRFFRAAPLAVGGGGGVNTDTLLAAGALSDARPSLASAPGVFSVGAQQLLDARGDDSLAYVTAGASASACNRASALPALGCNV